MFANTNMCMLFNLSKSRLPV